MMRKLIVAMLAAGGLLACGGGGGSSGPLTAPTVPSTQPPAVNVGGSQPVSWVGQASDAGTAPGFLQLILTQSGAQVTGTIAALDHAGPFAGTVSGNTLSFNFSVGMHQQGCGNAISGTATIGVNTMTGTFSGHDCSGQPVTNGTLTCALDKPLSATRFPVAGTWTGALPRAIGGGTSTWVISQDGDVNGGNLTGSVTVTSDNTLKLGSGSLIGTVTNNFPGPPWDVSATMDVTFNGACPTTMTLKWGFNGEDGQTLSVVGFAGSSWTSCNGPLTRTFFNIDRQ